VTSHIADSPVASSTALEKHGSDLRDILKQLNNLSYIVQLSEALQEATHSMELIYSKLLAECPESDGLLLEADNIKKARRRKRKTVMQPSVSTKKLRTGKCDP